MTQGSGLVQCLLLGVPDRMTWRACQNIGLLAPTRVCLTGCGMDKMVMLQGWARYQGSFPQRVSCLSLCCFLWSSQPVMHAYQKSFIRGEECRLLETHLDNIESGEKPRAEHKKAGSFWRFLTLAFSIPSALPAVQMGQSALGPLASRDV